MRFGILTFPFLIFLLIALSWPISGLAAPVPRETLEHLADIDFQKKELRHLHAVKKITEQEFTARSKALDAQKTLLWQPHHLTSQITSQELAHAEATLTGMTTSKLSLVAPQWEKEEWAFRKDSEKRQEQTALDVDQNARQAVEFQRERLKLQRQLDKGTIDRGMFNAKDRAALAGIEALRNKHDPQRWGDRFDNRLTALTKALADNPETFIPQSQVPATGERTPDFERDVKLAAELLANSEEIAWKFEKKLVAADTFGATSSVYNHDISRLRLQYDALKQGDQFEAAYMRLAAPAIQAIRMKYQPERYRPPAPPDPITTSPPIPPEPAPQRSIGDIASTIFVWLLWGGAGLVTLAIIVQSLRSRKQPADTLPPVSDNYGTAKWALYQGTETNSATLSRGVFFGKYSLPEYSAEAPTHPITSKPETHTLIVARTRSGKGTRVIIPTLLRYRDSMLVIDPKGENAAVTARTRRDQLKHTVHIINPWGELNDHYSKLGFGTATFNPLDALDRNDPNVVAVAERLATIICPVTDTKADYWKGSAAGILTTVLLWITDQEGLPRVDDPTQKETKTLARVRQIVTQSRENLKKFLVQMVASTGFQGAISEGAGQYIDLAPETYSGILSNLAQTTKFLSDPQIKATTTTSSFSMDRILDEYTTVYIVIPHDRIQTHATWLRLVIASAMHAIKKRKNISPPRHHRCMFLIDEFGSMGHIADIPQDIAVMSGYGLDFTLVVQNLGQLDRHYGKDKKTILGNCGYQWFCFINELDTANELSKSLGKKTVRTKSQSKSQGISGENATEGESTSYSETGRDLLAPNEVLNLSRDFAILLNPVTDPYYLRTIDYWNLPEVFSHLKAEYPEFYWNPPLTPDPNPYWQDQEKKEREQRERAEREKRREEQRQEEQRQEEQRKEEHRKQERGKQKQQKPGSRAEPMTEKRAREILGVAADATEAQIKAAYNRLMKRVHPDLGGSNFFAAQLNAAKDFLLAK